MQVSETQVGRAIRTQRYRYGIVALEKNGNKEARSIDHQLELTCPTKALISAVTSFSDIASTDKKIQLKQ